MDGATLKDCNFMCKPKISRSSTGSPLTLDTSCTLVDVMHIAKQTETNEMGGACSAYGGRGEVYTGFW